MTNDPKHCYTAPLCEVLALKCERMIATSVPDFEDGGDLDSLFT